MKTYTAPTPRVAMGTAAACMSALTFALLVGGPAYLCSPCESGMTVAAATPAVAVPIEVEIRPARIEVVGIRDDAEARPIAIASAKRKARG